MMWFGASPDDPRSSAIGLLLFSFHLPARGGGRRRSRRVGACCWSNRGRTPRLPLPFRGEGWGEGQGRTPLRHQRVHLLWREVVVVPMVEPHHRRVLARAQALDLLVAEKAVRRNLVRRADPDLLLHAVDDLVGPTQRAAEVGADVEPMLADRREMEQRVERRDA